MAPLRGSVYGLATGLLTSVALLWWLLPALGRYTANPGITFGLAMLVLGLWWGVLGWWVVWVWLQAPHVPRWLVFAIGWTGMEWIIGNQGPLAFPWLGLGTSLTNAGAVLLVQWADLAGARGVTLWLAASNAVLAGILARPRHSRRAMAALVLSVAVALGYGAWRWRTVPTRHVAHVGLVQAAIGLETGSDPVAPTAAVDALLERTRHVLRTMRPDLVVWPEGAVTLDSATTERPHGISTLVAETGISLVVGAVAPAAAGRGGGGGRDRGGGEALLSNNARFVRPGENWDDARVYRKRQLVPLVERGRYAPGRALPLFGLGDDQLGVMICFEAAFESITRAYRKAGADVVLNLSNDAWAAGTPARWQHAAHLVMRAIETRAGVGRVANAGIVMAVDPLGRQMGWDGARGPTATVVPLETGSTVPPYVWLGDWVALAAGLVGTGLTVLGIKRRRAVPAS